MSPHLHISVVGQNVRHCRAWKENGTIPRDVDTTLMDLYNTVVRSTRRDLREMGMNTGIVRKIKW